MSEQITNAMCDERMFRSELIEDLCKLDSSGEWKVFSDNEPKSIAVNGGIPDSFLILRLKPEHKGPGQLVRNYSGIHVTADSYRAVEDRNAWLRTVVQRLS
jgi:hypothetical protein